MEIYTIRDNKAGTAHTPFFQPTDIHALRMFKTEVNRTTDTNSISLYPEEFDLCHIGTFNDQDGTLDVTTARGKLANGRNLVTQDQRKAS